MAESGGVLFGTDGIRGIAGEFPLDRRSVQLIGRSLASGLKAKLDRPPAIIIGRDTRESGPGIEAALVKGATREDATVESAGVMTTPGVAFVARTGPFDAGVVISASHNPYHDNGIKLFSPSGIKLPDEMERQIERDVALWSEEGSELSNSLGAGSGTYSDAGTERHRAAYIEYLSSTVGAGIDLSGLRLCLDCANGAAYSIAPEVFIRLGARVEVIGAEPNGRNINEGCGSLHPESLQETIRRRSLDCGVAFDGDADRALFVDERGSLVDGDCAMLILAEHMKSESRLSGDVVVGTVMSNLGLEVALQERGVHLVRTKVGDRYVLEQMLTRGASLGGEQSGHIIFPDISLAGDGIITAIELLRAAQAAGEPLSSLRARLPRYPQVLLNVRVRQKPPLESLPEVKMEMERVEKELQGHGRLLVRYSGTENLARVMIEGDDLAGIEAGARRVCRAIESSIGVE